MKKNLLTGLLILALTSRGWGQGYPVLDEIDHKINNNLGASPDQQVDKSWLNETTKPIVIARLLKRIEESPDPMEKQYSEVRLIELGHVETIRNSVQRVLKGEGQTALGSYSDGVTLPYLISGINTSPVPTLEDSMMIDGPIRYRLVGPALKAIWYRENSFPPATREWAESMDAHIGLPKDNFRVDLLNQWWEHNKTAVLEQRYHEATWLPPLYKGKASYLSEEELADRRKQSHPGSTPSPEVIAPIQPPAPKTEIIAKEADQPGAKPATEPISHNLWIAAVAIVALLAGIVGWTVKTSGREKEG